MNLWKWTTKRYGERGEKRELFTFTLRHRAHDFPTFSGFNFPSAYFEICTVVRLESVGLVLKNASAPPRRVATTWKVSPPPPPCTFSTLKFHLFANLFNWSFRFFYYIKGVFWPARPFLVGTKKFFCLRVFGRLCASLRIFARFAIHRFTAIRGKLRVSEVCSNKLKFSPL